MLRNLVRRPPPSPAPPAERSTFADLRSEERERERTKLFATPCNDTNVLTSRVRANEVSRRSFAETRVRGRGANDRNSLRHCGKMPTLLFNSYERTMLRVRGNYTHTWPERTMYHGVDDEANTYVRRVMIPTCSFCPYERMKFRVGPQWHYVLHS